MRSSKKRSRSNQNRPRSLGNIVNRVFDSSGPEGKVRGTPQQIIEKYQALARDAQLSNDRVAAENFLQHAEHYTRMLAEAQRELAAEQEARQQQYQQNGNHQNGNRERGEFRDRGERAERGERPEFRAPGLEDQPSGVELIDLGNDDGGLVELPEIRSQEDEPRGEARSADSRPGENRQGEGRERRAPQGRSQPRDFRRERDARRREAEGEAQPTVTAAPAQDVPQPVEAPAAAPQAPAEAAPEASVEAGEARPARRPRAPRKPRASAAGEGEKAEKPADQGE